MDKTIPTGFYYDELDSTMDEAKRLIESGQIKDTGFVVANHQTKGRGTHGRKWSSPAGSGIYLSVIHLPEEKKYFETTTLYTQAAGVACVESIKEVCEIQTQIKPVNDIYVDGKKLGGILVESKLYEAGISLLITGIGINVKKIVHNLDRTLVEPISLEELLTKEDFQNFSKENLIEKVVSKICFWYKKVFDGNHPTIEEKWKFYSIK
ncbi:MAG: biotin--[acetyl-CoA-carboxylase] ligase [Candidatus Melainabacteria bacterium]|nr:biotin--[acetyl-CoA-carboxylase] ligase [Candidatus Melainabacteria bacterium]